MSNGRYQYEKAAIAITKWLHLAEEDLVHHSVTTTSGLAGEVKAVRLDDLHGLCFTLEDEPQPLPAEQTIRYWWPVSVIKLHGPKVPHA